MKGSAINQNGTFYFIDPFTTGAWVARAGRNSTTPLPMRIRISSPGGANSTHRLEPSLPAKAGVPGAVSGYPRARAQPVGEVDFANQGDLMPP